MWNLPATALNFAVFFSGFDFKGTCDTCNVCVCVRVFFGGGRRINLQPQALKFGRIGKSLHLSSGSHPEACLVQLMNGQWHADSVRHATNMQMNIFVVIELIAADC